MKMSTLAIIWVVVVISYLILAVTSSAITELSTTASTEMQASANLSQQPGIQGMVESSGVWVWFIPGLIGMAATVWTLKPWKRNR